MQLLRGEFLGAYGAMLDSHVVTNGKTGASKWAETIELGLVENMLLWKDLLHSPQGIGHNRRAHNVEQHGPLLCHENSAWYVKEESLWGVFQ
jgi:hypothetical protein